MTFRDIRFPTGIRYGAISGPKFNTKRARSEGGRNARIKRWTYPLRQFRVDRALKNPELKASFLQFFYNVAGAGDTFRIRDHLDYIVGGTDSVCTGVFSSLGNDEYQMMLRYTYGSLTKDIPCYLPISGTISVDGGTLVQGTHWSLDYTVPSGVMTMAGSPGSVPSAWTGQYDVHVSFENDELPISIEDEELWLASAINIIEERPE